MVLPWEVDEWHHGWFRVLITLLHAQRVTLCCCPDCHFLGCVFGRFVGVIAFVAISIVVRPRELCVSVAAATLHL